MAWFKVDDKLHASRKIMKIPRRHRLAAIGLWTVAGSWCADQETDGVVPDYMIEEWGGTSLLVKQLVSVGLWVQLECDSDATGSQLDHNSVATGSQLDCNWQFYNWGEYQPTRAQLEDGRRKNAEKLRKWRERNGNVTGGVTGLQDGSNHERNAAPDPTRPDPTPIREEPKGSSLLSDSFESNQEGDLLDDSWMPSQKHYDHAISLGLNPQRELARFRDDAHRKQRRQKNWNAAFTNWLKKAAEFNQQRQTSGQAGFVRPQPQSAVDKARAIAANMSGSFGGKEIEA